MKKLSSIALLLILVSSIPALSQDTDTDYKEEPPKFNLGFGIGLDYGGFGGRATFHPIPHLGIFAAGGYALVGFGYNVGAVARFMPAKRFCPTASVMYGYNGVIKVQNADQYNKIYYGASISGGFQLKSRHNSNFFNFELVLPFRSSSFYNDWDNIKNQPNINIKSAPVPLAFSVGYHFVLE